MVTTAWGPPVAMAPLLSFRPESFHPREMVRKVLSERGQREAIPSALLRESLDMEALEPSHGAWGLPMGGGEALPSLLRGEVEIARICIDTPLLNVWSVRARLRSGRYRYRIVDDFETRWLLPPKSSARPLTLQQLVGLIDGSDVVLEDWFHVEGAHLERVWGIAHRLSGDARASVAVTRVESELYLQLEAYYRTRAEAWVRKAPEWSPDDVPAEAWSTSVSDARAVQISLFYNWVNLCPDARDLARWLHIAGFYPAADVMEQVQAIYWSCLDQTSVDERLRVITVLGKLVELGLASPMSLIVVLRFETERDVVSTAALDAAMYIDDRYALVHGSTLPGPARVIGLPGRHELPLSRRILAGLLLTGDRRVVDLLRTIRDVLPLEDLRELIHCQSGWLYHEVITFLLEGLEACVGHYEDTRFGLLAAGFVNHFSAAREPRVYDVRRHFPGTGLGHPLEVIQEWSLADYVRLITPRLWALEAKESEPRIMPYVREDLGVPDPGEVEEGRRLAI